MNSKIAVSLLSGFLLASTLTTFAATPPPAPTHLSADSVDLPTPSAHQFHAKIPYASVILGAKPEELGRVFNAKKSEALLAKRCTEDLGCDWFVLNAEGADVVAFRLTDGRISKAALVFETVNATRVENMRKQLEAHADKAVKVDVKPIEGDGKKLSLVIMYEVDPLEFYLGTHTVDAKIAAALRQHTWVEGMTDEQATMVGDGPGKYAATYVADAPDAKPGDIGTGTIFAEGGGPSDFTIVIQARNKKEAREEALKRHKNFKDIVKISADVRKPGANTGEKSK
ncbi:MAG TPA: hypothetical protein VFE47_19530 [Tepidisphaeraceae bacterium]|jgi:hypothetical protein|nr:hypothetical protein [Tepidisphaeraceae bacterium]